VTLDVLKSKAKTKSLSAVVATDETNSPLSLVTLVKLVIPELS
jgi:hypothetical protein